MDYLNELIKTYGYWALLGGTFLEGETFLILGGIAAQQGQLQLPLVMLVAFIGSLLGDQTSYLIGRRWGRLLLDKAPGLQPRVDRALRFLERYNVVVMVGFRFVYGIRLAMPIAIALTDIKPRRFLLLNAAGAALWAVAISSAGYLFGGVVGLVLNDFHRYQLIALGLIALVVLFLWVSSHWLWKKM